MLLFQTVLEYNKQNMKIEENKYYNVIFTVFRQYAKYLLNYFAILKNGLSKIFKTIFFLSPYII